jgi:cytochrome c biogenesis protein CcmG, thiol:disulfide interchange protein DsbE
VSRSLRFLPVLIVALLIGAFAWRLVNPPDTAVPSKMIGKNLANLRIDAALPGREGIRVADGQGSPRVINFFGSWCVPCIAEMPLLRELKAKGVRIDGIAVRDRPDKIAAFLQANGDPYTAIGTDRTSKVQIAFGSSGVPETFIVDRSGTIRYQHIGPLEAKDVAVIRDKWAALK